jgi:hypothetical protein
VKYNEQQFHSVYTSLCHILHAIARIDVPEVQQWIRQQTAADIDKPGARETIDKLMELLDSVHNVHVTLRRTGLPPIPRRPTQAPGPTVARGQQGTG